MEDFRSQRMPSPEGEGVAKGALERAWDAYVKAVRPVTDPMAKVLGPVVAPAARVATFDLIGFWFAWHTMGGFDGLQTHLGMSRSAIYRRVSLFRKTFGAHPDVFEFPGVHLNMDEVVAAGGAAVPEQSQG